jgi:hypothetical protein
MEIGHDTLKTLAEARHSTRRNAKLWLAATPDAFGLGRPQRTDSRDWSTHKTRLKLPSDHFDGLLKPGSGT